MSNLQDVLTTTIEALLLNSSHINPDNISNSSWFNATDVMQTVQTHVPLWAGFFGCLIASVFFGSNFVPVKQYSVGDGFFFQFVFCVAVWVVGLLLDVFLGNQRFYPLVLVGGILWATGNLVTVFCIKTCGLTVGLLIWGTSCLIMGWAGARFGVFGIKAQVPSTSLKLFMNYTSVLLAAVSAIFFILIKSTDSSTKSSQSYKPNGPATNDSDKKVDITGDVTDANLETDFPFLKRLNKPLQKTVGCLLALMAGIFYGLMFIPDQYIRDYPDKFLYMGQRPPMNGLYYINSQYCGILLSSTFYFVIYALMKRNRPAINPIIAIPAMTSGLMWAIANIGFILAISSLGGAVAYPIVAILPGVVTSLWSLFWFREIVGKRNYIYLGCGMILRCFAALLSSLSA